MSSTPLEALAVHESRTPVREAVSIGDYASFLKRREEILPAKGFIPLRKCSSKCEVYHNKETDCYLYLPKGREGIRANVEPFIMGGVSRAELSQLIGDYESAMCNSRSSGYMPVIYGLASGLAVGAFVDLLKPEMTLKESLLVSVGAVTLGGLIGLVVKGVKDRVQSKKRDRFYDEIYQIRDERKGTCTFGEENVVSELAFAF